MALRKDEGERLWSGWKMRAEVRHTGGKKDKHKSTMVK